MTTSQPNELPEESAVVTGDTRPASPRFAPDRLPDGWSWEQCVQPPRLCVAMTANNLLTAIKGIPEIMPEVTDEAERASYLREAERSSQQLRALASAALESGVISPAEAALIAGDDLAASAGQAAALVSSSRRFWDSGAHLGASGAETMGLVRELSDADRAGRELPKLDAETLLPAIETMLVGVVRTYRVLARPMSDIWRRGYEYLALEQHVSLRLLVRAAQESGLAVSGEFVTLIRVDIDAALASFHTLFG
jgi:hypothetical protein